MTDKELIQALRWCAAGHDGGCIDCPGEGACDECSGKALVDAADRLEALLAENEHLREDTKMIPQWVSADERLPQDGQDVLAYHNDGVEARIYPGNYDNGKWFDCHFMGLDRHTTHWMPLPEPPSTEGVE